MTLPVSKEHLSSWLTVRWVILHISPPIGEPRSALPFGQEAGGGLI
jgi:hypothetical protein